MKTLLAAFVRNSVFANILFVLILVASAIAVTSMIRETFPEFSLDMISITVPYPGADPEEVEEGVSRKIEEAVEGEEGISQYTTTASEGVGSALIEIEENYDVSEVLDRVRSRVDAISNFPLDAEKPIITELTVKDSVVLLSLSGAMSERRLKEWANQVKDEIQLIPNISQVSVFGVRDYEIGIEVSEARLREYGITFDQVVRAVRQSSLNQAGGTIRTRGEEIRVRTVGRKYTGEAFAGIVVLARSEGDIITLDRLAHIDDGFTQDPVSSTVNGRRAVFLNVFKTQEEDALAISAAVHGFVAKKRLQLPEGADIRAIYDATDMLRDRINLLTKNGIIGLSLVFILLWLFLDLRLSFWAGMGIPISLGGGMVILWMIGATINMISLFGLIMVLGIVVDDAIVVGEAIYVQRRRGKPAPVAAVDGVMEVGMPVIAAVVTTIVAFLPLAFIKGIMGKFIAILPVVVIACLVISLMECMVLLPAHLNHLPLPDPERKKRWTGRFYNLTGRGLEWFVSRAYMPFLRKALLWRYVSLCTAVSVLMLAAGLIQGGIVKFEALPELDGFIITANVEFPNGTPPEITRQAVDRIEAALLAVNRETRTAAGEPLVVNRMSIIGQSLGQIPAFGPHLGGMYAILLPSERRGIHSKDVEVMWEKAVGTIPGARSVTFEGMAAGPPGAPIEVWIQGHDMGQILSAADDLMARLRQFDGVYQVRSDFSPGKNELRLRLKPEARALGLTVGDLAGQVYAGYYGEEAVRLQRGRDDIRVRVRYTADERSRLADFDQVRIRTAGGHEVPLRSVADIAFSPGYATITRTDGMRRVAVSAGVDTDKANTNEILSDLSGGFFADLNDRYPDVFISLQGEKKKMRESFSSLYKGFPLAMIGIFVIIATMFRSYVQPFVIMFTIPFGIIGAVLGHLLMGYNMSLLSIFGMVALTGVVVNDAIVLIERINENLAEGMPFVEAIASGGARRFRAIILTTLSTVGGLLPLISETDMQAKFLIPMALSLAAGVSFATVLTLVLIPSLLVILNDFRRLAHRMRHGFWPSPEAVEPARQRKATDVDGSIAAAPKAVIVSPGRQEIESKSTGL